MFRKIYRYENLIECKFLEVLRLSDTNSNFWVFSSGSPSQENQLTTNQNEPALYDLFRQKTYGLLGEVFASGWGGVAL